MKYVYHNPVIEWLGTDAGGTPCGVWLGFAVWVFGAARGTDLVSTAIVVFGILLMLLGVVYANTGGAD
jgi:hypothetical protein